MSAISLQKLQGDFFVEKATKRWGMYLERIEDSKLAVIF
jgi:hypothetical protein